ncbi:hypothetical protein PAXINDRAFT_171936 [Paxillus involutus ATCC 200175]|uniref:Uncharacterized protein n=1 Tax=Paxillus involutus ATCC 200175 TaxID=664439 RepID=A0A0C9TV65_PAXIN|nr:hypothetical protein PAXINDRAFT_171936 [Paxillus involutus ATCC 200175]
MESQNLTKWLVDERPTCLACGRVQVSIPWFTLLRPQVCHLSYRSSTLPKPASRMILELPPGIRLLLASRSRRGC